MIVLTANFGFMNSLTSCRLPKCISSGKRLADSSFCRSFSLLRFLYLSAKSLVSLLARLVREVVAGPCEEGRVIVDRDAGAKRILDVEAIGRGDVKSKTKGVFPAADLSAFLVAVTAGSDYQP
jgi:hypothetical protein